MRKISALVLLAACVGGCASSVERVADEQRQQRLQNANTGHPLVYGAADGVGGTAPVAPSTISVQVARN